MVYVGLGGCGAARRAFGIAVKFVQFDVARDGWRRNVRIGVGFRVRTGVLDRFAAALLLGDVGNADRASFCDDVGMDQDFPADELGVVDDVQAGLNLGALRQFYANALFGTVLVGLRCQQDVAARRGVGADRHRGDSGFGADDVAFDPHLAFPVDAVEVADEEGVFLGPRGSRRRRCCPGIFGLVVAASSAEQRNGQHEQ